VATWKMKRFHGMQQLEDYLNGVVYGTKDLSAGVAINGLTFIVDAGAGAVTVTFDHAPPDLVPWTPAEIVTFINTAVGVDVATLTSLSDGTAQTGAVNASSRFLKIFVNAAFVIDKDGTANSLLGFNTGADTSRVEVVKTSVVDIIRSSIEQDTYILVTNA